MGFYAPSARRRGHKCLSFSVCMSVRLFVRTYVPKLISVLWLTKYYEIITQCLLPPNTDQNRMWLESFSPFSSYVSSSNQWKNCWIWRFRTQTLLCENQMFWNVYTMLITIKKQLKFGFGWRHCHCFKLCLYKRKICKNFTLLQPNAMELILNAYHL